MSLNFSKATALSLYLLQTISTSAELPGSSRQLGEAVEGAKTVVIAKMVTEGIHDFAGTGTWIYQNAKFEVTDSLAGNVNGGITCSYIVTVFPADKKEELPELGEKYILIGNPSGGGFALTKVTVASEENEAAVRRLLGSQKGNSPTLTVPRFQETTPTPKPPPVVQPPATPKAHELKPSTPSEEPASSTPWSIIVVLIVAAIGLLWLLVKNRK